MHLWTSEAVAAGHPDKVADQIADAVLDAHLVVDPFSRVACEVTLTSDPDVNRGFALITGEITSDAKPDIDHIARSVLQQIGYDRDENSYNCKTVEIVNKIKKQSPIIANAVTKRGGEIGAGDQGIMFGFATNEASGSCEKNHDSERICRSYMPLAHALSFEIIRLLEADIKSGRQGEDWLSPFLPDAKSQVTLLYDENRPVQVQSILLSACHRSDVSLTDLNHYVEQKIKKPFTEIVNGLGLGPVVNDNTKWIINPAGEWSFGGPAADTGLSGRKIVVDNYGADCPVGGGSFSGKDPTKVDRSAAYAARYIAKNVVAAGMARQCQVQIAYAIGVVEPVSVRIQTFDYGVLSENFNNIESQVKDRFSLTPRSIIERFGLRNAIYQATASGGHFGREGFPWEKLDLFS